MDYLTDVKRFVSMAFIKTPVDSHEDATACYELQMPEIRRTQPLCHLWQPSCWDFARKTEHLPPKMALLKLQ